MDFQTGIAIVFAVIFLLGIAGVVAYFRREKVIPLPGPVAHEFDSGDPAVRKFFIPASEAATVLHAMRHPLIPGPYTLRDNLVVLSTVAVPTGAGYRVTVYYGAEQHITWNQLVVRSDEV
jgi:hypothetical protein